MERKDGNDKKICELIRDGWRCVFFSTFPNCKLMRGGVERAMDYAGWMNYGNEMNEGKGGKGGGIHLQMKGRTHGLESGGE